MAGVVCCCVVPLPCVVPRLLCGVPCLRIRSGTPCCPVPLCVAFPRVVLPTFSLCCCVVCAVCVVSLWALYFFPSPFRLCVCCHSIVGLGLCLCDRVMSLWNSGDGVWGAEGRVVSTVYCLLLTLHVLWCAFQCGVCVVLLCCVVGCGMAVDAGVSLVFLFLSLPLLCVGVRGSARAALRARTLSPNTIVFPLLCSLFSSLLYPRLSSCPAFPVIVEWRCVIHHVSVRLVGMTATGSLSRSSSFF